MEGITEILKQFSPTVLSRIGDARLMDRRDTKFIFAQEKLAEVLHSLSGSYDVLEINGCRTLPYETIYFDTPDFYHFRQHHSKRLNRSKIRIRRYLETNNAFLEVKHKNNHARTTKKRVEVEGGRDCIDERSTGFLEKNAPLTYLSLEQKLRVRFFRITLVNKLDPERVTIDIGLNYLHQGMKHHYERLIIAEAKRDSRIRSPFLQVMKKSGIRRFSISKYCLGIMTLHGPIRHNNFKPKIRYIKKLLYAPESHH